MTEILKTIAAEIAAGNIVPDPASSMEGHTGYAIHRLMNEAVTTLGLIGPDGNAHKNIPPQYVYNLIRNGQIDGVKGSANGRKFTDEQVTKFLTKWVTKRLAPTAQTEEIDETDESDATDEN